MTLNGRSIVVCRATHQAAELLDRLKALGAEPVHVPLIEVVPPVDGGDALRHSVATADASTWLAFTSANAVDAVASVLGGRLPSSRVAVVGRATAERAASFDWPIDAISPEPTAAGLGAWLPVDGNERVIAPLAELAGNDLVDALTGRAIDVEVVTAYRTVTPEVSAGDLRRIERSDAVLVTAPSVIDRLLTLLPASALPALVAIGPTSGAAVVSHGLPLAGQASDPGVDGLIDAVVRTLGT